MDSTVSQPSIPVASLLRNHSPETDLAVLHVEKQVEAALNDLVATGALQAKNRMDIESLLNPAGESHVLMESSDKEIYQAVIDSIAACENIEVNGRDMWMTWRIYPSSLAQLGMTFSRQCQPSANMSMNSMIPLCANLKVFWAHSTGSSALMRPRV
jgi:hypothetical protein